MLLIWSPRLIRSYVPVAISVSTTPMLVVILGAVHFVEALLLPLSELMELLFRVVEA